MNKEDIITTVKASLVDRPYAILMGLLLVVGVVYCLTAVLNIHPSDVVVYNRYTSFGEVHFYKDHWQYLLNFIFFGVIVIAAHVVVMIKLHGMGRRHAGMLVGWMGVTILLVSFCYTLAIVGLGHAA